MLLCFMFSLFGDECLGILSYGRTLGHIWGDVSERVHIGGWGCFFGTKSFKSIANDELKSFSYYSQRHGQVLMVYVPQQSARAEAKKKNW